MQYPFFKNLFDKIAAVVLFIIFLPILLLCIVAIMIEDPTSSPFFIQNRIGYQNKEFKIFKLRTMRNPTEVDGRPVSDRERLLKTGRFFRKASLDEIPQLLNILLGQMSFIGPRPLSVKYLPYYTKEEMIRHSVKPGISGWAQVNGRNALTWEERFAFDLEYVRNLSAAFDLKIVLITMRKIIQGSDVSLRGIGTEIDFHEYRKEQQARNIQSNG